MNKDGDEVVLGYASGSNVTFRGQLPTGVSRARWAEMSEDERSVVTAKLVLELVQVWVEDD